jgi:hypothetical protein
MQKTTFVTIQTVRPKQGMELVSVRIWRGLTICVTLQPGVRQNDEVDDNQRKSPLFSGTAMTGEFECYYSPNKLEANREIKLVGCTDVRDTSCGRPGAAAKCVQP